MLQHLQYLSSDALRGRRTGTVGNQLAQHYIAKQLKKNNIISLGDSYLLPFSINSLFNRRQGNNVVGVIEGTEFADRFIVLSAHFDHIGSKGNKIYNGADDNASGTAALIHYAKLIQASPLRHSVILLFSDGEEINLLGAKAFIQQNPKLIAKTLLNINIDMIAGSVKTKRLHYISRGLSKILSTADISSLQQQSYTINLKKGFRQQNRDISRKTSWHRASDHAAFHRQNIPFIYYGVGHHKNYHQISDTFENINHAFFKQAVDVIYQQISFIDQKL